MGVRQKIKGFAIQTYLSGGSRRLRGQLRDISRRARRQPRQLEVYLQLDDPRSHLLAQAMSRLAEAYEGVEGIVHIVPPPAADVDPQPALLRGFALADAREQAAFWDVELPDGRNAAEEIMLQRAHQVLIKERPFREQLRAAVLIGNALWSGDSAALGTVQGEFGYEASGNIEPARHAAYARMRQLGFYQGSSVYYAGEWYPGLDRLTYLEERLRRENDATTTSVLTERDPASRPAARLVRGEEQGEAQGEAALELEMFFSFRSPYSYLALDRTAALAAKHSIPLRVRPVLPMVSRGLQVPTIKRMYLVNDAKREAERLGIEFGAICDPLGTGVERCLAAFFSSEESAKQIAFASAAGRGIWSKALDMTTDHDLRAVVGQAGLDWDSVEAAIADESWKQKASDNADALIKAGLWGVPSFRIGDYLTWGQDRLAMLEDRIERHERATQ